MCKKGGDDLALTVRQEKFCLKYAELGNAGKAYQNAGYKCRNDASAEAAACRLLRNVNVQERLAELAEEAKSNAIADIREMQEALTLIIRQQFEEEVVVVESTGDFCSQARKLNKKPSVSDVIKAVNTLGKMQGAFIEKLDVNGAIPIVISGDDALED